MNKKLLKELDEMAGVKEEMSIQEKLFRRTDKIRDMQLSLRNYTPENLEVRTNLFRLYSQLTSEFRYIMGWGQANRKMEEKKEKPIKKAKKEPEIVYKGVSGQSDAYLQSKYYKDKKNG